MLHNTLKEYNFFHKTLLNVRFKIIARRQYEAIVQLESILGPEKLWINEYYILWTPIDAKIAA